MQGGRKFAKLCYMLLKAEFSFKYLILALIWGAIIYYFSSIPDLKSGFDSTIDLILRKGAHMFVYFVLTYLLAKSFNKKTVPYLVLVALLAIFYAISDEVHQLTVAGRSGSPRDVIIDSVGVFAGLIFYRFFRKK